MHIDIKAYSMYVSTKQCTIPFKKKKESAVVLIIYILRIINDLTGALINK